MMYGDFDTSLLEKMKTHEYAFHYHNWGVSMSDFESIPSLNSFFKVISYDRTRRGEIFPTHVEAYNHSVFGLLYHPEY